MANTGCSGDGIGSIAPPKASYSRQLNAAEVQGQAVSDSDHGKVSPHWEFFYRVAERFGIPAVVLLFVLYWARNDLIQPLLDAHFGFLDKITNAHDKHVEELQNIGDKLDTLIRLSDDK